MTPLHDKSESKFRSEGKKLFLDSEKYKSNNPFMIKDASVLI